MKKLYLVRHGKAGDMDAQMTDFERTLIERGENDSLQVAKRLRKDKLKPSLIISSPAPRALKTAQIIAHEIGCDIKNIRTRKVMYEQTTNGFLNIIKRIGENHDSLMLVGHNPSISDFAQFLIQDFNNDLPTCGTVAIKLKIDTWKEISQGVGILTQFYHPGKVKATKAIKQKDLKKRLSGQILSILKGINETAGKKVRKSVNGLSKTIVKKFKKELKKSK